MNFDLITFSMFGIAIEAVFVIFLSLIPASHDSRRVLPVQRFAACVAILGFAGLAGRDRIPDFFSVFLAQIFFTVAYVWLGRALRRLHGITQANRGDAAILIIFALFFIPPTFITSDWRLRTVYLALFLLVITIRNVRALYAVPPLDRDQRNLFRLVAFSLSFDLIYRCVALVPVLIIIGDRAASFTHAAPPSQFVMFNALIGVLLINTSFYWLVFDRTARESAELARKVRERETFLRSVTERAPSLLITARLQPDGTLAYPWTSRPLTEVFAFDPDAPPVDGSHPFTTLHPDDQDDGRRVLANSIRDLSPINAEWRFNTLVHGYRWTRVEATPYRDDQGIVNWFGSFTDIHDLKAVSSDLAERNRELLELVALKQRLLSIIAHDLKNPFAVILGISQHLARGTPGGDIGKWQSTGKTMHEAALAAYDLLENMLSWARAKEMPFAPRSLEAAPITQQALAHNATAAARKGVVLHSAVPAGTAVTADPLMLATVLRNLIANAVKFTPSGGSVTVNTAPSESGIEFSVTDTGSGIDPATLVRLQAGEAGVTTAGTENEEGSGLGLAVCRELLARHGSTLVISTAAGGSRFSFTLVAAPVRAESVPA